MSDVKTTKNGDAVTIRFERKLSHPVEKVWAALTERSQLNEWFPTDVGVDVITPDAEIKHTFRKGEGPPDEQARVIEFDECRTLVFSWYQSVLRFELERTPSGCVLVLTYTLADDGIRPTRDTKGWQSCLDELESLLS